MWSWASEDRTDRWVMEQTDGSTNYLLAAGDRLLELHVESGGATLHEYAGTAASASTPLATATYQRTTHRPDLAGAGADTVWAALTEVGAA